MKYLLIGGVLVLCCAVWIWRQHVRISKVPLALAPRSETDLKLDFIRDVCDGNVKRAEALLLEKLERNATLSHEQAVDLVYADMLELTSDERRASATNARAV